MRVLRLAQSWTTMRVLLSIILSSLGALANLTFVLAIVVYIFAVIGMQLFGRDYTPENFHPDPVPRWNFKDFFHSFMMIFRILCGEWAEPLWDCMRAERSSVSTRPDRYRRARRAPAYRNNRCSQGSEICFSIFLPALVMGNFLVLNLFLALLLNSFSCEELKSRKEVRARAPSLSRRDRLLSVRTQEINEDSKLVEGLKKIKTIAKATRTLVNLNSFERSESVIVAKKNPAELGPSIAATAAPSPALHVRRRSQSCGALRPPDRTEPAPPSPVRVTSSCSLDGSAHVRVASFYASSGSDVNAPTIETPRAPCGADPAEDDAGAPAREQADDSRPPSPGRLLDGAGPLSHSQKPGGVEKLGDWGILLPAMINVVPGIEAAKLARADTPSVVLSGQDDTPDEPPDCLPQSIMRQCGCLDTAKICEPICTRWQGGRVALLRVVKHPAFEWSILFLIFGSSITLCFEDIHLEENPQLMAILRWTNMAFAILFAIEMIIKWFALGLKYYFSSVWTALDFVIVMVSIVSVAVEDSANLSALRSLRTLRALRPLRAISRWQGMKVSTYLAVHPFESTSIERPSNVYRRSSSTRSCSPSPPSSTCCSCASCSGSCSPSSASSCSAASSTSVSTSPTSDCRSR